MYYLFSFTKSHWGYERRYYATPGMVRVSPYGPVDSSARADFQSIPEKENMMMNSLSGEAVYIDLCAAKDKKLFVQINAQGQHPFQGKGIYLEIVLL